MLTKEQINQKREELELLKKDEETKGRHLETTHKTIQLGVATWMSNLAELEHVTISFRYDVEYSRDYSSAMPCVHISITEIDGNRSTCFGYFDIDVKSSEIEYNHASGAFTSDDAGTVKALRLLTALLNHEHELRNACFEFYDDYAEDEDIYYKAIRKCRTLEKEIKDSEHEIKVNNAMSLLKEGALYIDGDAGKWYLKVVKITNKLVKCKVYYDYRGVYSEDNQYYGLNYMDDRQIKKDDFINRLISHYYRLVEEELKLVNPSWMKD